jgi:hypothetical protein
MRHSSLSPSRLGWPPARSTSPKPTLRVYPRLTCSGLGKATRGSLRVPAHGAAPTPSSAQCPWSACLLLCAGSVPPSQLFLCSPHTRHHLCPRISLITTFLCLSPTLSLLLTRLCVSVGHTHTVSTSPPPSRRPPRVSTTPALLYAAPPRQARGPTRRRTWREPNEVQRRIRGSILEASRGWWPWLTCRRLHCCLP